MVLKKNYFEFYDIPISFKVDKTALKRIFYANSKKYHPDFYTLESEEKQASILELSTFNNEVYKTLSDFDSRMAYILNLKGLLAEEGQNRLPQSFLMEMMEMNEALMELEFDFNIEVYQQITKDLTNIEKNLQSAIEPTLQQFTDNQSIDLNSIKDYYLKKRYLLRIRENLDKFVPR